MTSNKKRRLAVSLTRIAQGCSTDDKDARYHLITIALGTGMFLAEDSDHFYFVPLDDWKDAISTDGERRMLRRLRVFYGFGGIEDES